ncbi:MAG: tRNA preQ1(34) S-adenosylmethionine ribosyltransferase-isomerase QueA [Thermanaerothrix sp.]|nr:tRNA preQ1(34) S-adenosylmethionine ribosyltransferase-isomerase QueA [Thermanaerothrix sp.]
MIDLDLMDSYDYHLPEELIAQSPVEPRDSSRLMVLSRHGGSIEHRVFRDVVDYLLPGDLLVLNDTRVMKSRLLGRKTSSGRVEVFLLSPVDDDGTLWQAMVRPGRKVPPGTCVLFSDSEEDVAVVEDRVGDGLRLVRFPNRNGRDIANRLGEVPLPPYIENDGVDEDRYQTIYGDPGKERSVAAPTAGLHFTEELLSCLTDRGVNISFVTLDVGIGTFRPVKADRASAHVMHKEVCSVPESTAELIASTKEKGGRVIAVGTTVVRTLESFGLNGIIGRSFHTDLFIKPGFQFRVVDGLITNFHLPRSTLLMLVVAFAGYDKVMSAYKEAVSLRYRFFSFGDAMLIL